MTIATSAQNSVDKTKQALISTLQENLHSLVIYGSAVRGNFIPGVSDLNIIIVLKVSTPEAHVAIADLLKAPIRIEPMVLALAGLERTIKAFPSKFLSIQRHYQVIYGADPFGKIGDKVKLDQFLIEESLRNIRLRLVYNFVKFKDDPKRYGAYLIDVLPSFFTHISDALRSIGQTVPDDFLERLPIFEKTFSTDTGVLRDLVIAKKDRRTFQKNDPLDYHTQLCRLFDQILHWVEKKWPTH